MELFREARVEWNFSGRIWLSRKYMTIERGKESRIVFYGSKDYAYWCHIFPSDQLFFKEGLYQGREVVVEGTLNGVPLVYYELPQREATVQC